MDTDEEKAEKVHCHDCGMIAASSPAEEARANGFCHVKVFDARRRAVVGGGDDDDDQQEEAAAGRLEDDEGYYWLCPDCFHHMRETLLVADGGDVINSVTDVDN
jgi:hypothetical protein